MLQGAKYILEKFYADEFAPFIVQGSHGYGKSSYANCLIAEVYHKSDLGWGGDDVHSNWSIPLFKEHIGFYPQHVLDVWSKKGRKRDAAFHWDDAALWLHSLDFQDPFVKEVGKYMQVVRTDWACIIFTAISKEDIASKIRGLHNAIVIDITKHGSNKKHPYRRTARAYIERRTHKGHLYKDYQWEDHFNCHVPDSFYSWYKPKRDKYCDMAKDRMQIKLKNHKDLQDIKKNQ